jgi:hypothetical protein
MTDQDVKRGLYKKFLVERTDGSSQPGGKHEGCEYFVLDLIHDKHAVIALEKYAESCEDEYPFLYDDLNDKLAILTPHRGCIPPRWRGDGGRRECPLPGVIRVGECWYCVAHALDFNEHVYAVGERTRRALVRRGVAPERLR